MRAKLHARFAAWALIAAAAAILFIRYPAHIENGGRLPGDFMVYVHGWERAEKGENPYVLTDPSPYKYSPGVLSLMKVLPRDPAKAWYAFSLFSIAGLAISLVIGARYRSLRSVGLLFLGLALAWKGILETLDYGQLELLILFLGTASAALLYRTPLLSGFLAGILPWFKLPWGLLALPMLLVFNAPESERRQKKGRYFVSGMLMSWFVWGAAVPSLVFGPERAKELSQSWITLLRAQPHSLYFSDVNQSLWISVLRWTTGNEILALGLGGLAAGWLLGLLVARSLQVVEAGAGSSREFYAWLAPWMVFTQMLNPLSWRWGSVFVVGIPFAANLNPSKRSPAWRWSLAGAALVFWLFQQNPVVQAFGFHHWSDFHSSGAVTGYWLVLLFLTL